jgi:DNA repair photolyase
MTTRALVTVAPRTKVITKSTFKNYDICLNPYVGCEFGCSYCYVRFFVKDPNKEWGEFVRVRQHLEESLPKELRKGQFRLGDGREPVLNDNGQQLRDTQHRLVTRPKHRLLAAQDARLVIGTMTDPYQPAEARHRITRTALQILLRPDVPRLKKVGIFTRSPLVLQDLDLITQLPKARVHFTVTPFPPEVLRVIEPYSPRTDRRWETVKKLKDAGLRVHVNVSPVMPGMSEGFINEFTRKLAELKVDEYFVDPMQPYKESFAAFKRACGQVPNLNWQQIEAVMTDKDRYLDWKADYYGRWDKARQKHQHLAPDQLPIWSDHEHKVWIDMRTGQQMSHRHYGDG